MKTIRIFLVGMSVAVAVMISSSAMAESTPLDISVRMGFDADSTLEYFHLYEINGRVDLSPHMRWRGGWSLKPALVIAAGLLHTAEDSGFMAGIGPQLELGVPWCPERRSVAPILVRNDGGFGPPPAPLTADRHKTPYQAEKNHGADQNHQVGRKKGEHEGKGVFKAVGLNQDRHPEGQKKAPRQNQQDLFDHP